MRQLLLITSLSTFLLPLIVYGQDPCHDLAGAGLDCDTALNVDVGGSGLSFNGGVLSIIDVNNFGMAGSERGALIDGNGLIWDGSELDVDGSALGGSGISWNATNLEFDGNAAGSKLLWETGSKTLALDYSQIGPYVPLNDESIHFTAPTATNTLLSLGTSSFASNTMLSIKGNMIAKGLKVDLLANGWPDYVFDDSYELMPLQLLGKYLDKEKHLPEISSESQLREEGLDMTEINELLLKKIEELTLYIIEREHQLLDQDKSIEMLSRKLTQLQSNISNLKN